MKKITTPNDPAQHIAVFQETTIRRVWHNEEWWFAIVDVVGVLSDSVQPEGYVKDLRRRDPELAKGWGQIATPLRVPTAGGAQRVNCANTEGLFRIIQSIPSPKAEPFKRWLAQVGYERVKEIENPELASARARELYQAKGYPQAWIEKRLRSISVRGELTDEWKARGVAEGKEYSILTAEIARATFGVTPGEHSQLKGLDEVKTGNNLRDHMTDLELIFTMLGENGHLCFSSVWPLHVPYGIPPPPSHKPTAPQKTDACQAWTNRPPAAACAVRGSCPRSCGGCQTGSRSRLGGCCASR